MMDFSAMMQALPAMAEVSNSAISTLNSIDRSLQRIAFSLEQLVVLKADELNYHNTLISNIVPDDFAETAESDIDDDD